jgi:hypothetical protein
MYFPYLYAREGEMRAVEDLAGRLGAPQKVFPVLEPVVEDAKSLNRALDTLTAASEVAYVIVNPSRYKLNTSAAVTTWLASVGPRLADPSVVRPVLEIRPGVSLTDVAAFLAAYPNRPVGVSVRTAHIPAADLAAATAARPDVLHFLHSSADPAGYSAAFGATRSVEVRDSFRTEVRNADYVGEELFTTAHQHFPAEGRPGFADFTLLPGKFNATGGPLGAAVIHMSYVNSTGGIEVQHLVSDETRQYQSTQPAKLMEAMTKLDAQVRATPSRFKVTPGLTSFQSQFTARTPTSPTYNKRQQIAHHIDTVTGVV